MAEIQRSRSEWTLDLFEQFHKHKCEASDLLHLTMEGLHFLTARPHINRILNEGTDPKDATVSDRDVMIAERNAALAEPMIAGRFVLLHQQAVVSMWTGLESLVNTFFTSWLTYVPESRSIDPLLRTKVRLGEIEPLSGSARWSYVLERLEESLSTRRRSGIERFEILFAAFGLSSRVDDGIRVQLFELHQLRNCIVHSRGIADLQLIERCPQLGLSLGDTVVVLHDSYHLYYDAVDQYVFEIQQRVAKHWGLPKLEHQPDCRFYVEDELPEEHEENRAR